MRRAFSRFLFGPVIVMARPESFRDIVEEVKRDAVDFPLEIDEYTWRKKPVVLPSVSMVAATLPERVIEDLLQDQRVQLGTRHPKQVTNKLNERKQSYE